MTIARATLWPEDVARIWTEEERKKDPDAAEVSVATVYSYRAKSKPAQPGKKRNRYQDHPVPEPKASRGKRQPGWEPAQEQELRDWWNERPGRGTRTDLQSETQASP
ncbi:hypothetical protein KBX50_08405 [Micromonospora sp. C51]|uniref:hypothetical protein n=1 Tax=Micromonospora sp. C51 TaxID=2824879 RepID=UPI001B38EC2B|nr:hypothetical protein [Micromonospora sp. C51]MBQ1048484.1 hypothetical protein [Micromonospora sp. C51]